MSAIVELRTVVAAPPERCFDLSRSVELHLRSTARTGEEVVAGRASGLLEPGESVTWRARHFGIRQKLTARITAFDRPRHFRDSQVRGAFRHFDHDHWFDVDDGGGTVMRESFSFSAPWGPVGRLIERFVLRSYLRRFLRRRAELIRAVAEGEEWRKFLRETSDRSRP